MSLFPNSPCGFAGLVTMVASLAAFSPAAEPQVSAAPPTTHVALGWNDLGMHCMNRTYGDFCILPPFNNLWIQVVERGNPPKVTTQGISLSYRFPANTYSAGKVNFWSYEDKLFGVSLPDNVGLTGHGLTGSLDWNGTAFEVTGVPLTGFEDATPATEQPYQYAEVTVKRTATNEVLDVTTFVAPTSTEMHCDTCHSGGSHTVEYNILAKHDAEEGTNLLGNRPVLCASCHSSNALGTPGTPGVPPLSRAIHGRHAEEVGSSMSCYACHPGQQTQCLRGAMFLAGKTCTNCHGTITQVASSIGAGRRPWIDEPRCSLCHDAAHSENPGKLFRNSIGHGGLYCTACHNSPHAELPTAQPRDSVQAQRVQGTSGYIRNCTVCHLTMPTSAGPHGFLPTTRVENWTLFN